MTEQSSSFKYDHPTSPWFQNPRREEILREGHALNRSFVQIAIDINSETGSTFTKNACIGHARRIHLPSRKSKSNGGPKRKRGVDGALHTNIRTRHSRVRLMPMELPDLPISPLPFLGLTFEQLAEGQCRFPQGGDGKPMFFCGQEQQDKSSYCQFHHQICNIPHSSFQERSSAQQINVVKYYSWVGR